MLPRSAWRDFTAVIFSVALLGLGLGSTMPLTALTLTQRGFSPEVIGWTVAASAVGGVLATMAAPALALRLGRRNVMLACLLLASASVMPLQYLNSIPGWMLARLLFGAAMAPLFVLGESWINTLAADHARGRIVAIYSTCFTACQVLGPLLTDLLARWPEQAFLLCGGLFLLGLPGIMLAAPEQADRPPHGHSTSEAQKASSTSWLGIVRTAPAILLGTAFFASFDTIMLSFLPLVAMESGMSQSRALASASILLSGDAALQFGIGWLADHLGRRRVHLLCGTLVCLLLPLLPTMLHLPGWWEAYLFLLGGCAGAIYTLSMVASGEQFSGAALLRVSGLISLSWNASSSLGPAATGLLMQHAGSGWMVAVLWGIGLLFLLACRLHNKTAATG
ncbi:transporter, MFS superfamily [Aquitalea magnusonii]|uniref:Transporter, MFS superfamily n=1 Tax=Aquitalea magnusonii TaxID=332411 RepID=A0A3G9G9P2_9NEIS|nr:MFS transporter [Aquitalea magnusonii]BBF84650.1 transporter, MFS superfamily [Aquitalea magnusonii]